MLIEQTSELEWHRKKEKSRKEYEKYFSQFFSGGSEEEYSITISGKQ